MDYILTAESLWKSYKGFHALSGLNMHLPKGAIYGLVGRNGAGTCSCAASTWTPTPPT